MYDYLAIYEENELRARERQERDEHLSRLLDEVGLRGGAPQW